MPDSRKEKKGWQETKRGDPGSDLTPRGYSGAVSSTASGRWVCLSEMARGSIKRYSCAALARSPNHTAVGAFSEEFGQSRALVSFDAAHLQLKVRVTRRRGVGMHVQYSAIGRQTFSQEKLTHREGVMIRDLPMQLFRDTAYATSRGTAQEGVELRYPAGVR